VFLNPVLPPATRDTCWRGERLSSGRGGECGAGFMAALAYAVLKAFVRLRPRVNILPLRCAVQQGLQRSTFTPGTRTLHFAGCLGERAPVAFGISLFSPGETSVGWQRGCRQGWDARRHYQNALILRWHRLQQQAKSSKTHGII